MAQFLHKRKFLLTLLISSGIFILSFSQVLATDSIGKSYKFYLDPTYDFSSRTETIATLKKISTNAYFYIEDDYWNTIPVDQRNAYLESVDKLATEFDGTIYPSLTRIFGQEWKPGIDNDDRITILLTDLKSTTGGYFNERDEESKTQDPNSNAREMIYLNATQIDNSLIYSLFAHEMQHLISWNQKENLRGAKDDVWLNELRSEYAPTVCGYDNAYVGSNLERRVDDFLARPFDSVTEWKGDRYDYPSVNLLGHYMAEQFGENIFKDMMQTSDVGIKSIEDALASEGYDLNFSQVFDNWAIANFLNDTSLYAGQYGYKNPYLKGTINVSPITYSIVSANVINIAQKAKDWDPYMYRFFNKQESNAAAKDLEIDFDGTTSGGNFSVLYIINYISQNQPVVGVLNLTNQKGVIQVPDFKDTVDSITVLISNQFKTTNFTDNDPTTNFDLSVATTIFTKPPVTPPTPPTTGAVKPEDFGLKEGDLIRAEGDIDVFIINEAGYKRLFLNPAIFNMYGHLGGWSSVKTVRPQVRDAFITSNFYRYVDSPKVYELEVTGEDTGKLHWLNMTGENFVSQGGKPDAVFIINKSELNWYPKGADKTTL